RHGPRVAHQHEVDSRLLGDLRGGVVVGGHHHYRLGQPLLLREPGERHRERLVEVVRDYGAWGCRHLESSPYATVGAAVSRVATSRSTLMIWLCASTCTT